MNTDRWVTLTQAATVLGKSKRTIHRVIEQRQIESRKQGRETIVNLAELWDAADSFEHGGIRRRVADGDQEQVS